LGNPSTLGKIRRTVSIFLIIDWVQEKSLDIVLLDLDLGCIANSFFNGGEWLPVNSGESGLDVRGVGDAKFQITIQGHCQWTHVERKDTAGRATKDGLLEGFPRVNYLLGW
jgi:hypothetical protein